MLRVTPELEDEFPGSSALATECFLNIGMLAGGVRAAVQQLIQAHGIQFFAQLSISLRQRCQSVRERFYVKPTSPDNDRESAARINFIDGARRGAAIFFSIHFFLKRRCPNEMMRNLG